MKLSEFANLQSGLVLNRKEARSTEKAVKTYKRLNLRSLDTHGVINHSELDDYQSKEFLDDAVLTQPDDIVVKLFAPLSPVLITTIDAGLVIPSQLAVIRIHKKTVLPQYLRYWLSTPEVSDALLSMEGWQSQKTIKIGTFADLDVPIPSLEMQTIISNMVRVSSRREQLYQELIEEQKKLTSLEIQKIIGGNLL